MEKRTSNFRGQALTALLSISLFAAFACYIVQNWASFSVLLEIRPVDIFLIGAFSFLSILSNGIYHKFALGALDIKLSVTEWLGIPAISFIVGSFAPFRADVLMKGVYYKKKCGLAYAKYASLIAGSAVITLMMDALHLALGIAVWGIYQGSVAHGVAAALIVCACFLFLWTFFRYRDRFRQYVPFKKRVLPIIDGFADILSKRTFILACVGTLAFSNIAGVFRIYAAAKSVHAPCLLFQAVLYDFAHRFSGRIALIPGNIGVTESMTGLIGTMTGEMFQHGVMLSLLIRVVNILTYGVVALAFLPPFLIKIRKKDAA